MSSREKIAIVLAAGQGTRMDSELPKVLVPACERPLIEYVLDALDAVDTKRVYVVVGYRSDEVRKTLAPHKQIRYVEQTERLGTGHAVKVCRNEIENFKGDALVLTGDSPMMRGDTLKKMVEHFDANDLSCLLGSIHSDDPHGLGRIVRDAEGNFTGIVEEKDATEEQRKITEVNMSYYLFRCPDLVGILEDLKQTNKQKEYYITDAPAILLSQGKKVDAIPVLQPSEALGVNTMEQLKIVEEAMRREP
jgi:bifunctional UDP-N-acetylglucosamine pyrophosphorylase / glucosamine-1-phosphate N-acetyltransferase